jgi:hypothetical protein
VVRDLGSWILVLEESSPGTDLTPWTDSYPKFPLRVFASLAHLACFPPFPDATMTPVRTRYPLALAVLATLAFVSCEGCNDDDDDSTADDDTTADDDATSDDDDDATDDDDSTPTDDDDSAPVLGFCPTRIDVFGYSNVANVSCGGYTFPHGTTDEEFAVGFHDPGNREYDRTLAGLVRSMVLADTELTEKFGTDWEIRSCATGSGLMRTFVDDVPEEPNDCKIMGGPGIFSAMCTEDPSPVALYSANNVNDWCHGGGSDAPEWVTEDDPEAYVEHWVQLLEEFLRPREIPLVLVSPQHEWHAQQQGSLDEPETCFWSRPEWNRVGAQTWMAEPPQGLKYEPLFIGDMQDEFKRHHPCCELFEGYDCDPESWYLPEKGETVEEEGDGWVHFGCDGAAAVALFWFNELKGVLMNQDFDCE